MPTFHPRWALGAATIAGLLGCHSATPQEQMQAAQSNLLSEAEMLQRCEATNGYASETCSRQHATYDHDLAAFRAKYGR
jgi:hypothetical protein